MEKPKNRILIIVALIALALVISIVLVKCGGDMDRVSRLEEKAKELVKEEQISEKLQSSYEDTAQYYAGRALAYQLKADSVRGDTSLRALGLKQLESKIRLNVEALRRKNEE